MTFGVPGFGSTIRDDQRDSAYQALAASADFASVGSILGSGFYNFIGLSYWNAELGENMQ